MATTDYERNPRGGGDSSDYTKLPSTRSEAEKSKDEQELLSEWVQMAEEAEADRKQFLPQIKVNRKFAAGKQHLNVNTRDGRVVDIKERNGIKMVTADILTPYLLTVVGRMAANDVRPNFIAATDDEVAAKVSEQLNMAFGWGWDNEWLGDPKILQLWRLIVIDGTAALRVRYDKNFGEIIGDFPLDDNEEPIMDKDQEVRYRADSYSKGKQVKTKTMREGKVVWELLSFDNLLPPPGFDDPNDFPWEIVVRPILISDLKSRYGEKAKGLVEEEIEGSASITAGLGLGESKEVRLKGRVLVYTGYKRPCADYPRGQVVVFTKQGILDDRDHLPYDQHPRGPSTGLHYFRWQVIPGRFPGRAFIEGGIGPQQIRNKRLTQIDAIIDRNMPFVLIEEQSLARRSTGAPMEYVEIRPGAPIPKVESGVPPGRWMLDDVKLQEDNAEKAMGLKSVTTGQPPQGVTAYSAMALLTENDALKLDAIANDFALAMREISWDTMEAMRNWPSSKHMLISGPEDQLQTMIFNANQIPDRYLVRIPRGGSLPRSQAAELQKINDIWTALGGMQGGVLSPEWYVNSINTGKAQDLPPKIGDLQLHKAELENIVMAQMREPLPVAETDDHARHGESHRAFQIPIRQMADLGDEGAAMLNAIFEQHLQEHLTAAQGTALAQQQPAAPAPPMVGPSLPPQNLPQQEGGFSASPGTPPLGPTSL